MDSSNTVIKSQTKQQKSNIRLLGLGIQLSSKSLFAHQSVNLVQNLFQPDRSGLGQNQWTRKQTLSHNQWPEVFREFNFRTHSHGAYLGKSALDFLANLTSKIHYIFSDGVVLTSREILFHQYAEKLAPELLPDCNDTHFPLLDMGPWQAMAQDQNMYYWGYNLVHTLRIMHGLWGRIIQSVNKGQTPLYLLSSEFEGAGIPVGQVLTNNKENFSWNVTCSSEPFQSTMQFAPKGEAGDWHFLPEDQGAIEIKQGILYLNSIKSELKKLCSFINYFGEYASIDERQNLPTLVVSNSDSLFQGVQEIRGTGGTVHFKNGTSIIPWSSCERELHISATGDLAILQKIQLPSGEKINFLGASRLFLRILSLLNGGLPRYFGADPKMIATSSKNKRFWDLKLLKHMGIFQYIVLELSHYNIAGTLSDGTIVKNSKKILTLLEKKICLLLDEDAAKLGIENLANYCTGKIINLLNQFIEEILNDFSENTVLYALDREIIITGQGFADIEFLLMLLKENILATNGQALKKSKESFIDKIIVDPNVSFQYLMQRHVDTTEIKSYDFRVPTAESGLWQSVVALRPLAEKGTPLFIQGQPLEGLKDGDFSVNFTLSDSPQALNDQGSIDWFSLHPKFFLKGKEIDSTQGLRFSDGGVVEYKGKLYLVPHKQIPSLQKLESFWLRLQSKKGRGVTSLFSEKIVKMPRSQILELLALRSSGYPVQGNAEWEQICAFYDSLGTSKKCLKIPKTVQASLKPYQRQGVQWLYDLYSLRMGALLGDDMGLGKTLQTLTFLETLRVQKKLGLTLIVVPPSLIYNWESESQKFVPQLPVRIFATKNKHLLAGNFASHVPGTIGEYTAEHASEKTDKIWITTYGVLTENEVLFSSIQWNILVFDEAQNLKNITTKRTSAARSLQAQFKICLTGTPMENHYGEFYSLMDLLVPGSLGGFDDFKRKYVTPDYIRPDELADLRHKVKPLVLRRMKKEILDQLPEKIESKVSIPFESKQKSIYRNVALAFNQQIEKTVQESGESKAQLQMLTALLRLRQVCSDPAALPNVTYSKTPPKLEALMDALKEIIEAGSTALVFTQFRSTLERTKGLLEEAGIPVYIIHGGISATQRRRVLEQFQNQETGSVLLMTLKTGGVGLNLTKANYVFHLEPWWNPSVENQATDRAHRLGQNQSVQVYKYIMHESVEEKIELLKGRKESQFRSLFSEMEMESDLAQAKGSHLTKEDFAELVRLDIK